MNKPPNLPCKFRLLLTIHYFISKFSRRRNTTVNRRLTNLFDPKISPSSKPRRGVSTIDTAIDPSRHLWFRIFIPSAAADTPLPLIIYFHGGGFVFFSPSTMVYDDLGRRLARQLPAVVVSVNYRLSPEFRYPTPYEDGFEALKFLDSMDSGEFPAKVDFQRCFIAGDSAGGNLAHNVAVRAGDYEFKKVKISGLIAIQPFFGGEERTDSEIRFSGSTRILDLEQTDWFWKAFLPEGSDRNHAAARVVGGQTPGSNFPATLVITGGLDQLQDWGRRYFEWLKRAGKEVDLVEYPDAIHGFYAVPELPEDSLLMKDVGDFIHKQSPA